MFCPSLIKWQYWISEYLISEYKMINIHWRMWIKYYRIFFWIKLRPIGPWFWPRIFCVCDDNSMWWLGIVVFRRLTTYMKCSWEIITTIIRKIKSWWWTHFRWLFHYNSLRLEDFFKYLSWFIHMWYVAVKKCGGPLTWYTSKLMRSNVRTCWMWNLDLCAWDRFNVRVLTSDTLNTWQVS